MEYELIPSDSPNESPKRKRPWEKTQEELYTEWICKRLMKRILPIIEEKIAEGSRDVDQLELRIRNNVIRYIEEHDTLTPRVMALERRTPPVGTTTPRTSIVKTEKKENTEPGKTEKKEVL